MTAPALNTLSASVTSAFASMSSNLLLSDAVIILPLPKPIDEEAEWNAIDD